MRDRLTPVLARILLALVLLATADKVMGQKKAAVPDAAAQAAERKTAGQIYGGRFQSAKTIEDKSKLAAEMIDAALQLADGSPGQYVLLGIARDIAAGAGDATTALTAVAKLAERFDVPSLKMQAQTLLTAGRQATTTAQHKDVAEAAAGVIEQLAGAGEFELGLSLCKTAQSSAQRAKEFVLVKRLAELAKDLERGHEESRGYREAVAILESDPTNPAANLAAGQYLCFVKGDWDQGIPMLALSSDAELKAVATKELRAGESAKEQVAIGDDWWDLAETQQAQVRDAMRRRAGAIYRKSFASLDGLDRIKVQQRIDQLQSEAPKAALNEPVPVDEIHCFEGQNYGVFSPDGRQILTSSVDNSLRLWDVATKREIRSLTGHTARVRVLCFVEPKGDRIVSIGDDGTIRVWDTETAREVNSFNVGARPQEVRPQALVIAGGKHLLWSEDDPRIRVTDLESGKTLRSLDIRHGGTAVYTVAFSQDGRWALSGGFENTVRMWSMATGKVANFDAHTHVYGGALSPDGRLALTVGGDRLVRLWNMARRVEIERYTGHSGHVYAAAFSPDGHRILSGDAGGEVRLWDTKTAEQLHCYQGHTKPILRLSFSPDGRYALSSGKDETVRLLGLPP